MPSRYSHDSSRVKLQYSSFVKSLLAVFPELQRQHERIQEDIGPDVLPFPTVELVFEPFVKALLKTNVDRELIRRVFHFLEEMARAQDTELVNLLHVGIFESWMADSDVLTRAWPHMGENTRRIAADVAHRLNLSKNLPRAARR